MMVYCSDETDQAHSEPREPLDQREGDIEQMSTRVDRSEWRVSVNSIEPTHRWFWRTFSIVHIVRVATWCRSPAGPCPEGATREPLTCDPKWRRREQRSLLNENN